MKTGKGAAQVGRDHWLAGVKLRDAANFAVGITSISLDDHLSHSCVRAAIDDETELDALVGRIDGRIHSDGRREVTILSEDLLHALNAGGNQVFVKLLPNLQFAAVHQLVCGRRTRRSVHHQAADKQLLFHYEIHIERTVRVGCDFGGDSSESSGRKELLQACADRSAVKKLSCLEGN